MEKIWYIFDEKYHKGPYSKSEVLTLLERGTITIKVLIWRSGMDEWIILRDCKEIFSPTKKESRKQHKKSKNIATKKEIVLPALPRKDSIVGGQTKVFIKKNGDSTKVQAEEAVKSHLVLDESQLVQKEVSDVKQIKVATEDFSFKALGAKLTKKDKKQQRVKEILLQERNEDTEVVPIFIKSPSRKRMLVFTSFSIFFIAATLMFFFLDKKTNPRMLSELTHVDIIKLEKILYEDDKTENLVGFALSLKGNSNLWVAMSRGGDAHLQIRMQSIRGGVLADDDIVITGKSKMVNGTANFAKLNFDEGKKFVSGHYKIQIIGKAEGSKSRFISLLKKIGLMKGGAFLDEKNRMFRWDGEYLLAKNSGTFQKKLIDFNKLVYKRKSAPIDLMLEKYKTFYFLLERLEQVFISTIKSIKYGRRISRFKLAYATEIAPVLQTVIQDNHIKQQELSSVYPYAAVEYQRLVDFGKKITALAADSYSEVRTFSYLKKKQKKKFITSMEEKVIVLKQEGNGKIKDLTAKLEGLTP